MESALNSEFFLQRIWFGTGKELEMLHCCNMSWQILRLCRFWWLCLDDWILLEEPKCILPLLDNNNCIHSNAYLLKYSRRFTFYDLWEKHGSDWKLRNPHISSIFLNCITFNIFEIAYQNKIKVLQRGFTTKFVKI